MATKMNKEQIRQEPPHYNFKFPKEHVQVATGKKHVEEKVFSECYLSLEKYKCKPQLWFAKATKIILIFLKENDCLRVHEGIGPCMICSDLVNDKTVMKKISNSSKS